MTNAPFDAGPEFDRQVRNLIDKGYPALAGLAPNALLRLLSPLRDVVVSRGRGMTPPTDARVPFVLVPTSGLVPPDRSMPLTSIDGRAGFADYTPEDIARFQLIKGVAVPRGRAYLVFDVDRGEATLNVTPDDAIATIAKQGRTPITVDEGIAFITQFPAALAKNKCFHTAASRCGDRRVPALWISKRAPKLGWCWAGNRHTWLGTASCSGRAGSGRPTA